MYKNSVKNPIFTPRALNLRFTFTNMIVDYPTFRPIHLVHVSYTNTRNYITRVELEAS